VRHVQLYIVFIIVVGLYIPYFIFIYPMTSTQDRTNEFKACVDSIRHRSALGNRNSETKRLLQNNTKPPGKGEFSHMASSIGKDISSTTVKLNKLAQCTSMLLCYLTISFMPLTVAKRKTLFDDRPVEISVRHSLPLNTLPLFHTSLGIDLHHQTRHCRYK
jgi:hypothetical protein